ncbi:MAG: cupin domain-containing protein [Nostocoides sp.]
MTTTPFAGRTAQDVIKALHLQPLEGEGSFWAAGPRTRNLSSITVLLTTGDEGFSAMHKLEVDEGWQWVEGAPAVMLRLGRGGHGALSSIEARNGQVLVTADTWQGAATLGDWTLLTCWCAPAFTWSGFVLADRDELQHDYPDWSREIEVLTRVRQSVQRAG